MRRTFLASLILTAAAGAAVPGIAADQASARLVLPAQKLAVDLESGLVTRKDITGPCLETVSRAGPNTLVVAKTPGDDIPTVTVNGAARDLAEPMEGAARLGAIRITRDGALFHLRTWKTGRKQTELVQDGEVRLTFERGTAVRLLRATEDAVLLLVQPQQESPRLLRHARTETGRLDPVARVLLDFGTCRPGSVRIKGDVLWAQMACPDTAGPNTQSPNTYSKGIYRIDLPAGTIGAPVLAADSAEFVTLPRSASRKAGETVLTVSGSPAALHFFYAATGLLLSQTGEVRACSSDAEGLQSWNQSYRLRALSSLFAKTGAPVFADLARKSMDLSVAARDGVTGRTTARNPACGWSSRIYAAETDERLSLMINQAMIAGSLGEACRTLGKACPGAMRARIASLRACLIEAFEPHFDPEAGLYRIQSGIAFRYASVIAPWNWQIAFAGVLKEAGSPALTGRAEALVRRFAGEWGQDGTGALWRYWPREYYAQKGISGTALSEERFEDTGHAGISLLTAARFKEQFRPGQLEAAGHRLDFLLAQGPETPRDLDGSGPRSPRWFPSGGWSGVATDRFRDTYAGPVPGRRSANTVLAYADLFDPAADFQLTLTIHICTDTCTTSETHDYTNWRQFLSGNPLFVIAPPQTPPATSN